MTSANVVRVPDDAHGVAVQLYVEVLPNPTDLRAQILVTWMRADGSTVHFHRIDVDGHALHAVIAKVREEVRDDVG